MILAILQTYNIKSNKSNKPMGEVTVINSGKKNNRHKQQKIHINATHCREF